MELMSIREFADLQGITYEACRKQVARYSEELSGHVIQKNRTRYLDEVAVKFLQERRRESPIILQNMDQGEEISRLQEQMDALKAQLVSAQNKLLESQERIISLQDEIQKTLEDKARYTALLEDNEAKEKKLQETESLLSEIQRARDDDQRTIEEIRRQQDEDRKTIEDLQKQRDEAVTESKSYVRSWFGFYRKI